MDLAALIIAVVAVVIASISLGWQIASFFLAGARVRANLKGGALGHGGVVTWEPDAEPDPQHLVDQGFTDPVLAVEVVNIGRMPVTVSRVGIRLSGGLEARETARAYNPALPYRLEPHSSETWYTDLRLVIGAAETAKATGLAKDSVNAWGVVDLATGKRVETGASIRLV